MFYEIYSRERRKSYLFGTIHINDKEVTSLPIEVKLAFDNASSIVLEADISDEHSRNHTQIIVNLANNWKKVNNLNGRESYSTTPIFDALLQDLMPISYKLSNALDLQLLVQAKRKSKNLIFLETSEEQLIKFMGCQFDYKQHLTYVDWKSKKDATAPYDIEQIKKDYLNGIIRAVKYDENTPEIVSLYRKALIAERDQRMAESMKTYINKGNAFIAVGAAHLEGITQKLASEGYTIKTVSLSERIYPIAYMEYKTPEKAYSSCNSFWTSHFKKLDGIMNNLIDMIQRDRNLHPTPRIVSGINFFSPLKSTMKIIQQINSSSNCIGGPKVS